MTSAGQARPIGAEAAGGTAHASDAPRSSVLSPLWRDILFVLVTFGLGGWVIVAGAFTF